MLLGTATASTTSQFNLSYIPQYIEVSNITTISRIRVTALGDGIVLDLDAAGIAALANTRFQFVPTATKRLFLANGVVKGKNCVIEITNGATVANVYASSLADSKDATLYFQAVFQKTFANTGTTFQRFSVLAFPSAAATDYFQVLFNDGTNTRVDLPELRAILAQFQAGDNTVNDQKWDNLDSWIQSVTAYVAADMNAYVQKYVPVGTIEGKF